MFKSVLFYNKLCGKEINKIFSIGSCKKGGHKGCPKTAKKNLKNCNATSKFTNIPRPQLQMC